MKRWYVLLLLLALLLSWVPVRAEAATILGSGSTGQVGWYIDSDYNLYVSGNGTMGNYTSSGLPPWYNYRSKIVSVTVEEGVTSIGKYCFYGISSACLSWSFPSTLVSIGDYAFNNSGFSSLCLPDSVISFGNYAFNACYNLTSFTFPSSISSLSNRCFNGISNLSSVYFLSPEPPQDSYGTCFVGCSADLKIYVPAGSVDAYKSALPAYANFIVGSDGGDGSGGSTTDGTDYYSLWVKHEDKAGYYWGSTCQFYADWNYTGDGVFDRSVTWSVTGSDSQTAINDGGLLTIGPNETQLYLTVTATSVAFPSLSSTSTIRITQSTEPEDGGSSGDGSGSSGTGGDYAAEFDELDEGINNLQTAVDDVGSAVETLPGSITSGMQDIMDQQQSAAESQGQESVDQIIEIIPNESQGFLDALGSLVDALGYNGTDAVLTVPAIKIPAVGGLFPETVLCAEQTINFGDYFAKIPENLLMLVRALFDIAIVVYCVKEFLGVLGGFINGYVGFDDGLEGYNE